MEWDCEGTSSKLQRVPRALRFGLQLVVDQMLQTLKSCSVCRAPYIINHHEHLSCFMQLGNRMTAQVLALALTEHQGHSSSEFPATSLGLTIFGEIFTYVTVFFYPTLEVVTSCLQDGACCVFTVSVHSSRT